MICIIYGKKIQERVILRIILYFLSLFIEINTYKRCRYTVIQVQNHDSTENVVKTKPLNYDMF